MVRYFQMYESNRIRVIVLFQLIFIWVLSGCTGFFYNQSTNNLRPDEDLVSGQSDRTLTIQPDSSPAIISPSPQNTQPPPSPTNTPTPLPTSTPTMTPTPTPLLLVEDGTPIPAPLPPISIINAELVSGLAEFEVNQLTDLDWTPDGSSLAAATIDNVELFDVPTRKMWRTLHPESSGVRQVAFSRSGQWMVSSSRQGTLESGYYTNLERWYGLDLQPLGQFVAEYRGLSDIAFSSSNQVLFAAYSSPREEENEIELWDTVNWVITDTLKTGVVLDLSISNSGDWMATTPDRYAINIWDLNNLDRPIYTLHTAFTDSVTTAVFSPDGTKLASAHYDGSIGIWDVATGMLINSVNGNAAIQSLAFSPDGSLLVSGNSYQKNTIDIWWVDAGSLLHTLEGHSSGVDYLLFSPGGEMIVSGTYDGVIRIWGIRP